MMSLIISLGVILILAILYLIFRVSNLITIAKGPRDEKGGMANVTIRDVYQSNGVIHVIDHVVMPK